MKRWAALGFFVVVAAALLLRCGDLARRPMHNDEAINAFKLQALWNKGEYRYDPHEYHGPALYYFSLPILAAVSIFHPAQPDETGMRAVSVVFGVGLILLIVLIADGLGWPAALGAGLLTAISPAFVFYSRYYIHEIALVFFTFLTLVSLWRYSRNPGWGWACLAGVGGALMYATKETFIFAVVAAVASGLLTMLLDRTPIARTSGTNRDGSPVGAGVYPTNVLWVRILSWARSIRRDHLLMALVSAVIVWALLFTSFLVDAGGMWDAIRTYFIWFERAGGQSPHAQPWYFYLHRLTWFRFRGAPIWTEAAILGLAMLGAWVVLRGGDWLSHEQKRLGRFLLFYSLILAIEYTVIPYKTPWCLLGFHHGFILMAGYGIGYGVARGRSGWARGAILLLLATAMGHLVVQAWRSRGEFAADFRNPYVYGHTSPDVVNLLEQVQQLSQVHPDGRRMPIQVIAPDSNYWPLPWYWRAFEQVGWWDQVPENPYSSVVVVANKLQAALDEKSNRAWLMVGMFELRPRFFVELYVEAGLWRQFLAARAAER